jgi:hypothetical protein
MLTGIDTQDADLLEQALQDFDLAQFLFDRKQAALAWRMYATAASIELARFQNRREDHDRYIKLGQEIAQELAKVKDNPLCDNCFLVYYRATGDLDRALQIASLGSWNSNLRSAFVAVLCLRRYGAASAFQELEKRIPTQDKHCKEYCLARALLKASNGDETEEVKSLVENLLDDPSPFARRQALFALCLVCGPSEVQEYARRAVQRGGADAFYRASLFNVSDCLDYLAGLKDEQELLSPACAHGHSRAMAHFTIAMMCLSAGDRGRARSHMEMAVATTTTNSYDYEWANAYLECMKANAEWPSWKPQSDSGVQEKSSDVQEPR